MKLNAETLQRLSLDAALGQLCPDVRALWEAYLNDRPALAEKARRDQQTVSLARQALAEAAPAASTAALASWKAPRRLRRRQALNWVAAAAAGLIIGLVAGLHISPDQAHQTGRVHDSHRAASPAGAPPPAGGPGQPHAASADVTAAAESADRFWSVERLYRRMFAARSDAPNSPAGSSSDRIIWQSPVDPRIITGEAL